MKEESIMRLIHLTVSIAMLASLAYAQAPVVNAGGVVNNGSYAAQGVAPGSIVAIFGSNLAAAVAISDTIPLSTSLGTVTSVTFNNVPAPLYFVGPTQLDAQLPYESLEGTNTSGTVNIVVTTNTGSSAAQTVNVIQTLPGIFTVNQRGTGQAIATDNADAALAAPVGSIPGATSHPFSIGTQGQNGHALVIWCTGLGAVTPPIADGANSYVNGVPTLRHSVVQPPELVVLVGGVPAQVLFSGLAPGFVSEFQIDVLLGPGTPTGNAVPVQIQVNGLTTSSNVTVAVSN
jgi:uncharacterized protein (TIGR03437 family)